MSQVDCLSMGSPLANYVWTRPADCLEGCDCGASGIYIEWRSVTATKAKCGFVQFTAPEPDPDGPKKYFLKRTIVKVADLGSEGTTWTEYNPITCQTHSGGGIGVDADLGECEVTISETTYVIACSYTVEDTEYTYSYTHTLTDEFTTSELIGLVDLLIEEVDLDSVPWGQSIGYYYSGCLDDPDDAPTHALYLLCLANYADITAAAVAAKAGADETLESREEDLADAEAVQGTAEGALWGAESDYLVAEETRVALCNANENAYQKFATWNRRKNEATTPEAIADAEAEAVAANAAWTVASEAYSDFFADSWSPADTARTLARLVLFSAKSAVDLAKIAVLEAENLVARYAFDIDLKTANQAAAATDNEQVMSSIVGGAGSHYPTFAISKDEATVTKRFADYRIIATVPRNNGGAQFKFQWREVFVPRVAEGEEPTPVFTPREETVTATDGERRIETSAHRIGVPEDQGASYVVGFEVNPEPFFSIIERKKGAAQKVGFSEFANGVGFPIPQIYRKVTASGSFAGCPAAEREARTYAGSLEISEEGVEDYTFSDDVYAWAAESGNGESPLPVRAGRLSVYYARVSVFTGWTSVTPTERSWESSFLCDPSPVPHTLTMTLESEFTTDRLKETVDTQLAGSSEWDEAAPAAENYLSPDELTCRKERSTYRVGLQLPTAFPVEKVFSMIWKERTLNLVTGEVTFVNKSQLCSFDAGSTYYESEEDLELNLPAEERRVELVELKSEETDPLMWGGPTCEVVT